MQRVLEGIDPVEERDAMTDLAAARERVVLGLRRRDGLDRTAFFSVTGFSLDNLIGELIARWVLDGLAQDNGQQVRLTRPGLLVSDALWGEVLLNR
jgi:oxygen-independent coproporphyrinogen-3 oxidase